LDRTGPIVLSDTSEHGTSAVHELNLRNIQARVISLDFFPVLNYLDSFIKRASSVDHRLGVGLVGYTCELIVLVDESCLGVLVSAIGGVSDELPGEDVAIPASRDEARVIIEPVEALDRSHMRLVDHFLAVFSSIELVDIDV